MTLTLWKHLWFTKYTTKSSGKSCGFLAYFLVLGGLAGLGAVESSTDFSLIFSQSVHQPYLEA